jgi:glycoprotein endo-alpha-1,2-mannosidase
MRPLTILLVLACLVVPGAASGGKEPGPRVSVFFYPWYGTPARDGLYHHWHQGGSTDSGLIASSFFPSRGLYSSGDPAVLRAQMREIRLAGIDQVVTSWWGWGSLEDLRLPAVLRAAKKQHLDVAVHLEPYQGRTLESMVADVERLRALGITDFYVYDAEEFTAEAWALVNRQLEGVRLFAQTGLVGFAAAAGFDGLYTYDILTYGGQRFGRLCEQARSMHLLCAPSVGPGYDARRSLAADKRIKPRRDGKTYDAMWSAAFAARADLVTITSYNEWHEGSQIEPARKRGVYANYDGAYGLKGKAAETAYLDRTARWSKRFRALPA